MDTIQLKDIEEPATMDCLTKGITFRFETFAHFEYVRSCSHVKQSQGKNAKHIFFSNNKFTSFMFVFAISVYGKD